MAATYETLDCNTYCLPQKPKRYQQVFVTVDIGGHTHIISTPIPSEGIAEIEVEIRLGTFEDEN